MRTQGLDLGICSCPHEDDVWQSWESHLESSPLKQSNPCQALFLKLKGKESSFGGERISAAVCPHGTERMKCTQPHLTWEWQCLHHTVLSVVPGLGHFHFCIGNGLFADTGYINHQLTYQHMTPDTQNCNLTHERIDSSWLNSKVNQF